MLAVYKDRGALLINRINNEVFQMNKELRRLLELSGIRPKNEVVKSLYEGYSVGPSDDYDGRGPVKGLEGPFRMRNGRVVYYDPKEGKYYDPRSDIYLSDEEANDLRESTEYVPTVVLHAKKGDEKLALRLEGVYGIRPAVTLLRNNGYGEFAYSDGEGDAPVSIDSEFGPEEEPIESKLQTACDNLQSLIAVVSDGEVEIPEDIKDQLSSALGVVSDVHASLVGGDEDFGDDEPEFDDEENPMGRVNSFEGKGRARDTKHTPSLSRSLDARVKKALKSKERQQGRAASRTDEGQATFSGWKAAVKKKYGSDVEFEGDKDICQAFVKTDDGKRKGVAEWDGAQGELYEGDADRKEVLKRHIAHAEAQQKHLPKDDTSYKDWEASKKRWQAELDNLSESAVDVTVFDNTAMPANAVDDAAQKAERTGQADRTATKNVVPKDVIKAIDSRISELKAAISRYDNKGYNDGGVKGQTIKCLEQIKKNLQRGDYEGFMEAQMFFLTLMSPITDMIPAQVVNYLAKGDDRDNPDVK